MAYQTCEDCGSKIYSGHCTWCHEEVFIAQQYREMGEPVPETIAEKEGEQIYKPSKPWQLLSKALLL